MKQCHFSARGLNGILRPCLDLGVGKGPARRVPMEVVDRGDVERHDRAERQGLARRLSNIGRVFSLAAAGFGLMSAAGWALGVPMWSGVSEMAPMKPNTALALALTGAVGALLARQPV